MSDREQSVLKFIKRYRKERGISPTFREIGRACNISSTSIVSYYLKSLERRALIRRHANVPRGIVLL